MSLIHSNIRRELFSLSVLRYNMEMNRYRDQQKFKEFAKQVDIQEYYLFQKHKIFPGYKSDENIILSLNHLSNIFHNPKSKYTVYQNGFIFSKNEIISNYTIPDCKEIKFPLINDKFSYCNVNERECYFLELHFLLFKSMKTF